MDLILLGGDYHLDSLLSKNVVKTISVLNIFP